MACQDCGDNYEQGIIRGVRAERTRIEQVFNERHKEKFGKGGVDKDPDVIELRAIFGEIFDYPPEPWLMAKNIVVPEGHCE